MYQKRHVLKRDWNMCSKFIHYSQHNSQHDRGNIGYDHIITPRFCTLTMNRIFSTSKNYEESGDMHALNIPNHLASINCVPYHTRRGCKEKVYV